MDAKEQLRRYLEQRREMGEKELVLDGMSVEDALALLGANAGRRQSATVVRTHVVRSETVRTEPAPAEPRAGDSAHIDVVEQPRPQLVEREISESQIGDWRAALGTFAAQTLLDTKTPLGKLRGEVHRYHGVPLIVTYHPAALLRNPSWKRPTWEDVQLAHRILAGASAPNADA